MVLSALAGKAPKTTGNSFQTIPTAKVVGAPQTEKLLASQPKDGAYYDKAADYAQRASTCVLSSLKRSIELYDEVAYADPPKSRLKEIEAELEHQYGFFKTKLAERLANLAFEGETAGDAKYDVAAGLDHHIRNVMTSPFSALEILISNDLDGSQKQKQVNKLQGQVNGIIKLCVLLEKIDSESVKGLFENGNHFSSSKPKPVTAAQQSPEQHREQALEFLDLFRINYSPVIVETLNASWMFVSALQAPNSPPSTIKERAAKLAELRQQLSDGIIKLCPQQNAADLSRDGSADAARGLQHLLGQAGTSSSKTFLELESREALAIDGHSRLRSICAMLGELANSPDNARYFLMTEIERDPDIQNVFLSPGIPGIFRIL